MCLAARLLGARPSVLGSGAHATAFSRGCRQVLKVVDAQDKAALWFARFARRQTGPHWPRVIRVRRTSSHIVLWTDRLYSLNTGTLRFVDAAEDLLISARHHSLAYLMLLADLMQLDEPWQQCPSRLRKPLLQCMRQGICAGFARDSKRTAWMRRLGGTICLVDPFVTLPPRHTADRTPCLGAW